MKKVSEVLAQSNSQQTITGEQKETINGLFGMIKAAYPNFLRDQDELIAKRLWASHLSGYSAARVQAASAIMVDRYPSFPPTIGEFKALLKELNVAKPAHQEYKALPRPKANEAVARANLERMNQILREAGEI